ncbi:MAG: hypothetical protein M3Z20_02595 [Chloroflexota bacterium]|nr:hypothetical protein [Chloroflexota bacterium]
MMDPTAARNDRLRDTGRWGYTGDMVEDPVPEQYEERGNSWLIWLAVVALIVIAAVMLIGPNL